MVLDIRKVALGFVVTLVVFSACGRQDQVRLTGLGLPLGNPQLPIPNNTPTNGGCNFTVTKAGSPFINAGTAVQWEVKLQNCFGTFRLKVDGKDEGTFQNGAYFSRTYTNPGNGSHVVRVTSSSGGGFDKQKTVNFTVTGTPVSTAQLTCAIAVTAPPAVVEALMTPNGPVLAPTPSVGMTLTATSPVVVTSLTDFYFEPQQGARPISGLSPAASATHSFNVPLMAPGSHLLLFNVVDAANAARAATCTALAVVEVAPPECDLVATPESVTQGGAVTLRIVTDHFIEAASIGTVVNPPQMQTTITASTAGTHVVEAAVQSPWGNGTCEAEIEVSAPIATPTCASLTLSKSLLQPGEQFTATMQSSGIVRSALIDNQTVASPTGTATLTAPTADGTYAVVGLVSNESGIRTCSKSYEVRGYETISRSYSGLLANRKTLKIAASDAAQPFQILSDVTFKAGEKKLRLTSASGKSLARIYHGNIESSSNCPAGWQIHFKNAQGTRIDGVAEDLGRYLNTDVTIPEAARSAWIGFVDSAYFDNEGNRWANSGSTNGCSFGFSLRQRR